MFAPLCLTTGESGTCPRRPPARASGERLPREVVYVGVTKNLNARPIRGRHDGVSKYHEQIDSSDQRLFVAFAPLFDTNCVDYDLQRIYAEYVEALLVWKFTEQQAILRRCILVTRAAIPHKSQR